MEKLHNREFNKSMRERTKQLALQIIELSNELPEKESAKVICRQLLNSVTSVVANFHAACRGWTKAEYYVKMCAVVEDANETQFWLELLQDSKMVDHSRLKTVIDESAEILTISTSIKNKLRS